RRHVQSDAEEHLEADQEGDPLPASDDPEALTQLLGVRRFCGPGDRRFDEREGHQDRDQIQGGTGEQGEPQVAQRLDDETSREGARGSRGSRTESKSRTTTPPGTCKTGGPSRRPQAAAWLRADRNHTEY